MGNPTALIVLLIAAAAVASASGYTTTVVTTRVREDMCEKEMEQKMPMEHCMMYMEKQMRGPYYADDFLRSAVAERRPMREEEHLNECCAELGQVRSMCRCSAVKQMMMDMPQLEMKRMACSLPSKCGMDPCACPRY